MHVSHTGTIAVMHAYFPPHVPSFAPFPLLLCVSTIFPKPWTSHCGCILLRQPRGLSFSGWDLWPCAWDIWRLKIFFSVGYALLRGFFFPIEPMNIHNGGPFVYIVLLIETFCTVYFSHLYEMILLGSKILCLIFAVCMGISQCYFFSLSQTPPYLFIINTTDLTYFHQLCLNII